MKSKLWGLLAFASLVGFSPAHAATFTYDVDYAIGSGPTITGDIVLNCDFCDVTSSTLVSWSMDGQSGTSATFSTGSNLIVTPSAITYTPVLGDISTFIGSSAAVFFGVNSGTVSGGTGKSSCSVSLLPNSNEGEAYGTCSNGALTMAASRGSRPTILRRCQ